MAESGMFREVVYNGSVSGRCKEITVNAGGSSGSLHDIKLPDSAGGYTYKDSGRLGSPARNRFIYWRVSKDVLELSEQSLDYDLHGNVVKFRFQDTAVLCDITVFENQNDVIVLVATVSSVHRLIFPHPNKVQKQVSIFMDASIASVRDPTNSYHIRSSGNFVHDVHAVSSWLTNDGEALFALATQIGSILLVKLPAHGIQGIVTQHELKHSTMMQRLWTGLVPSVIRGDQAASDMTLSLALHPVGQDVLVFAVCRDHKIRVWSCKNLECVMVTDMLEYMPDNMDPQKATVGAQGHMLRKSCGGASLHMGVFLNFADRSQFCIFHPVISDGRYLLHHITTLMAPNEDLVDFSLNQNYLWALWTNSESETVVRSALLESDNPSFENWSQVILCPPEPGDIVIPLHREPRETYMEYIFHPGRFTTKAIVKALNIYRRSLDNTVSEDLTIQHQVLKEEVIAAVENEIRATAADYELQDEEYFHLQAQQWSKFYSGCLQYHQVGTKPLGLLSDSVTGMVAIIKKNQLSYLRPCELIEHLYLTDLEQLVPEDFNQQHLISEDLQLCQDVLVVVDCIKLISNHLMMDAVLSFEHDLYYLEQPDIVAQQILNSVLPEAHGGNHGDDLQDIQQRLQTVEDVPAAIGTLLQLLDLARGQPEMLLMGDLEVDASSQLVCNHLFGSPSALGILSHSLQQMMDTRLATVRDLLFLEIVMLKCGEQVGWGLDVSDQIRSELVPKTCEMVRAYVVMKWATTTVASPVQTNAIDSNLRQLDALDISETTGRGYTHRQASPDCTVVELFLSSVGGTQSRFMLAHNDFLVDDPCALWSIALQPMATVIAQLIWPISANFLFPEFLMGQCQYLQLQDYIRLLSSWCQWNSSSRKFLLGQCYLNYNEPNKALDCFLEAVHGVGNEDFLLNKLLATEETSVKKLEVLFYMKTIRLLEQFSLPDHIIRLANTAISVADEDDLNIPILWSKIFKYQLELGHNREAYTALISNPDPVRRKDCLRQFLVILCDRSQLQALVEFPYIDLHDEVVSIIESRARSVDLTTHNYYDLLYSFHVFRGNYHKAGSVMYEYGMRLGQEVSGLKGLQKQAKCYLACMNALRLVDPKYAWIVKPVPRAVQSLESLPGMSPKRSIDGEERNEKMSRKMEVIELEEIEKEYMLVHARLLMIQKDMDSSQTGPRLNPSETVGLLVSTGLFDTAVRLCKAFDMNLNQVFEGLAHRCVQLSKNTQNILPTEDITSEAWDWLTENDVGQLNTGREVSSADQAWWLLQIYLQKYETVSSVYHKCVAIKLLTHGFFLPDWLQASYKVLNPAELLRLYIDYDLLEDAAYLASDYIDAVMGRGREYFGLKTSLLGRSLDTPSVWLPYTCLDQLLLALKVVKTEPLYYQLYETLSHKLGDYHREVERASKALTDASVRRGNRL